MPVVYRTLMGEYGDSGKAEAFFFGSHPKLAARAESAEAFLAGRPESERQPVARARDRERFVRRIRPVIRDDARLNLEMGRLALAEAQLTRVLAMMPEDPEAHLVLGRLRMAQADPTEAARAFREAIRLDPDRPLPHRELGLLAYRAEDFRTACVQFRHYLELESRADDVPRIRDYVLELQRQGDCP